MSCLQWHILTSRHCTCSALASKQAQLQLLDTCSVLNCRIRTSSGAFLKRGQDDAIQQIEQKIAKLSGIPVENGEGLQILNYEASEKYEAHFDYFHDQSNQLDGGQRLATMLMYLSDVEEGGETVFPASRQKPVSPSAAQLCVYPLFQPYCMGCVTR